MEREEYWLSPYDGPKLCFDEKFELHAGRCKEVLRKEGNGDVAQELVGDGENKPEYWFLFILFLSINPSVEADLCLGCEVSKKQRIASSYNRIKLLNLNILSHPHIRRIMRK